MKAWFEEHPLAASIIIWVADIVFVLAGAWLLSLLFPSIPGYGRGLSQSLVLVLVGVTLMSMLRYDTAFALVAVYMFVLGAGLGRVHEIGIALVAGIVLFFVLEKFLLWRHCHTEDVETHEAHEHHRRGAQVEPVHPVKRGVPSGMEAGAV